MATETNTPATLPTFTVTLRNGRITAMAELPTIEDAQQAASLFPKSIKLRAMPHTNLDACELGALYLSINTTPNKNTGDVNETGARRYRSFLKTCERLGFGVDA